MRKLDHRVKLAKVVLMHVWSYNGCILIRYGADYALETSHTVRLDHESHPNPANLASPAFARYPRSSDEMRTLLKRLWFEGKIAGWSSGMLHVCKWFEVHTFFWIIISFHAMPTLQLNALFVPWSIPESPIGGKWPCSCWGYLWPCTSALALLQQ